LKEYLSSKVLVRELQSVLLPGVKAGGASERSLLAEEVTGLFDQMRNPLLRYLLSFGLTAHDGEEIIQEVFLALFQHLQRKGARTNLRGWVFRVAHNLGLRRCNSNYAEAKLFSAPESIGNELHPDPDPNPEEHLMNCHRRERLLAVVEALPEIDRRCLYLRGEGLRYREIVEVLGMSLGAVALSLERSLARLRRADGQ
jgi:RNA polymerase sigma-70 factor (ECF subfamily)